MGCWAFGIYQSDDSMDWESELHDQAGLDRYDDDFDATAPAVRAAFEAALPAMVTELAARDEEATPRAAFYKAVGYQMLACLLMRYGCAITNEMRQSIVTNILACPEYQNGKFLLQQSGGQKFSEEVLEANGIERGFIGYAGSINRFTGRISAIERLVKEFGEYDIAGGSPHDYKDQGSLELYGEPEPEATSAA